jgi:hypothetical protein
MVRQRNTATKTGPSSGSGSGPPAPFKEPPEVLQPFVETLDDRHVYITHIDNKPADFKRRMFLVPVAMNLAIAALFLWRLWYITPYYLRVLVSVLGYPNEMTIVPAEMTWEELIPELGRRSGTFILDFLLFVFLWPWPVQFAMAQENGNPVEWRWQVGFRDREVVVRRSRSWDESIRDVVHNNEGRSLFMSHVGMATAPMLLNEKTGYLLMNKEWDLDWKGMVDATTMVDKKMAAIEAFKSVVLVHHSEYGWLSVDLRQKDNAEEEERRQQIFAFRDALSALGKEDLFYRWIEIVQFESSQPGGFTKEKQVQVADQIREMFDKQGVNFDQLWKEAVGTDANLSM